MQDRKLKELSDKVQRARETVDFMYDMGGGSRLDQAERQLKQIEEEYYAYRQQLLERNVEASCRSDTIASNVARNVMAWTIDRGFYVPKDVEVEQIDSGDTDLDIRVWEKDGKLYGIAFAGKQNKPLWYYHFSSTSARDRRIKETIESRKMHTDFKQKMLNDRKQFRHTLQVGDILVSSWGYDQTNASWYQVVGVGEKSVKIREIEGKAVSDDREVASTGNFVGPIMTKIVGIGDSIRINSYSSANKWDGKPVYVTPFGIGH